MKFISSPVIHAILDYSHMINASPNLNFNNILINDRKRSSKIRRISRYLDISNSSENWDEKSIDFLSRSFKNRPLFIIILVPILSNIEPQKRHQHGRNRRRPSWSRTSRSYAAHARILIQISTLFSPIENARSQYFNLL